MENHPASRTSSGDIDDFLDGVAGFADVVFGFDDSELKVDDFNDDESDDHDDDDDGDGNINLQNDEAKRIFWETQDQLLQSTLCRTTSSETKIRQAAKQALKEMNSTGLKCVCRRLVAGGCRDCLLAELSIRLQSAGLNSCVCKSKWKSSEEIPSGEHTYLEVMDKSNPKKREMRVIIEPSFRAEFELARASEDYKRLVNHLPQLFVGKAERLKLLVDILCGAAKKSMKEKRIHLAPWRRHNYVQAKWFRAHCQKRSPSAKLLVPCPEQLPKPKVSMLTFDLSAESFTVGLRRKAVAVV